MMSRWNTPLVQLFGLKGPLVIAPMGGGPTTPELVAATCNAGALGSLAAAYLSPEQIDESVAAVRRATPGAFAINLFAPLPPVEISEARFRRAIEATRPYREELGLAEPQLKAPYHPDFEKQFEAVLRANPRVFSFVFGLLDPSLIEECRKRGIFTMGTATTPEEALALEALGVDAVVAQGVEAGAHRGIFSASAPDPGLETLSLTRACAGRLRIPVIAAGGLMTGEDMARALRAGAQAAMMGTAFLLCPEAGTSKPHRMALKKGGATRLTRAFSGRLARGMENRFLREMEADPTALLPFPAQNALTRDIRTRAAQLEKPDFLSLWAGTGVPRVRELKAAELVRTLFEELESAP